ncbi:MULTISPECIES: sugar ABC transporter permease [unclassified Mesorhizobium]|uniref:carbohydrate ABC transporter permease n=1 Tax=unclassified Mesorhizobium TaxID=325217 RepID=UPI000FE2D1C4|nr:MULTISPECIES: sugar ABC transporter permease [unclassified Mesorhizobium]RWA95072.1 MAG: sugar ABC transporter permease [Mesorhizobium sp.]RWC17725.1 MAG: sugar ABC transporter permease [Mesorhizobium sp.]RWD73705.1 MAG: sugar ABC transporter permease [Mesorhizobium sp.]RWE51686.1 MAG: sugar ABC transporter permease [Mesorhizobium sp.]RWE89893.1 MAG: sugar ABC transporter permease [Mesorhizobium sp.]
MAMEAITEGESARDVSTVGRFSKWRAAIAPLLFLTPALVALIVFRLLPAGWLVQQSLSGPDGEFAGLDNFEFLFTAPSFAKTLHATLTFVAVTVPLQTVTSFGLALLFAENSRIISLLRTLVFLPVLIPSSVAAILWGAAYRPQGLANALLTSVGVSAQPFLTSPDQALMSIIVMSSWVGVGFWMIFLIGGLKDIPRDLYEAASIDGAGKLSSLWHITIPLMRRPLAFVIVADTVSAFLLFGPIAILTRGGPGGSTQLIMYDVYQQAYFFNDVPLAAAEGLTLMVIMMVIILIQFRLLSREKQL